MEQHAQLVTMPCHYCAGLLNPTGSALDRVDNGRGYEPDNVVPCCTVCNVIKGQHLTHDEMAVAMHMVKKYRNLEIGIINVGDTVSSLTGES